MTDTTRRALPPIDDLPTSEAARFLRDTITARPNIVVVSRSPDGTTERHFVLVDGTNECEITHPDGTVVCRPLPHSQGDQ